MVNAAKQEPSPHAYISLDEIKASFQPADKYRVSPHHYQVGTVLPGTAKEHVIYVLSGAVEVVVGDWAVTIAAGFESSIPAGSYWLTVKGDITATVVDVFDLDSIRSRIGWPNT